MIEPTRTLSLEEDRILLNISDIPDSCHYMKVDETGKYGKLYMEEKQINKKNEISFMDFSNFDSAWKTAEMLCKAKCIPQRFWDNPADALVVIQFGHEVGLSPMRSLQTVMVVNNIPSVYGDAMLALCMSTKGKVGGYIDCIEIYNEETQDWTCTVIRDGVEKKSQTFTLKDAELGGFLKKPGAWQTNRKRMMQLRSRAFTLRDMFPDILMGIMTVEEMRDVESFNEKNIIESKSTSDSMKERLKAKQSENLLTSSKRDIL